MSFQRGQPRPAGAGRKPGSTNKKTVLKVEDVLARNGVNPIEQILRLIPDLKPNEQVRVYLELQSYCEPKPKAPDVVITETAPANPADTMPTASIVAMLQGRDEAHA